MRPAFICFALFISAHSFSTAAATSFDCSKATTEVERTICDDEQLSLQDDLLTKTYEQALSVSTNVTEQKAKQRTWLKSIRNTCADATCLSTAYSERIHELKKFALPGNDHKACSGEIKKVLDLALAIDSQLPDSARTRRYGRMNDGSLNYGGYWLRTDISLMYARLRCWQSARDVIGKIGQEELQETSKASLSIDYAKASYFGPALDVLDSLKSEEAFSASAYGIAEALVVAGRTDQAKDVIMQVTTRWRHLESPSYVLIQALVNSGRLIDAEKIMEGIDYTWNEHLLLANAYMKDGKEERAEPHIQEAVSMAGNDPDAAAHVQERAAYIYIDAEEFEKAYTAASGILRPLGKLQAYLHLAEALHRAKRLSKSDEMYSKAIAIISEIEGDDKSSKIGSACSYISKSYGQAGNVKKVQSTVATLCPDKSWKSVALGGAINELAKLGDVNGAQLLQSMLERKNDAGGPIAVALAHKGEYEQAASMTRGITNEAIRSNAVRRMAALTPPPNVIADWLGDTKTFKHDDQRAAAVQALSAALARSKSSVNAMAWLETQPPALEKARGYFGIAQGLLGIVPGARSPGD
jgi:uncharacterized protein